MPRWLYIAYRLATALVLLALIAAGTSLIVSVFLDVASLWDWAVLRVTGLRGAAACM